MKKVLITGWNKWIGLATTKLFLEKWFRVIILARDFSDFKIKNDNLEKIEFDLKNTSKILELCNKIWKIDILINNAWIMHWINYLEYNEKLQNDILNVNLVAQIELIKWFEKLNDKLRIVNNASIAGEIWHPDIWYGITKAWVINMTKSFAKILWPKGIVINCISAWPVETDMLSSIPEARKESIKSNVMTGRFARPEEIAETFYFLWVVSPEYINWICIDVNNWAFMR